MPYFISCKKYILTFGGNIMKNLFKLLLILIYSIYLSFYFGAICNAQEDKKIIIGIDINVPPMGFLDKNGEITGFDVELAKETFKIIGKEVVFQPIDWDAKELELNTGKIDAVWNGLSYSHERAENMLLTKSYMQNRQVVIVKNNDQINDLKDLYNKTICVQKGSTGAASLKNSDVGKNAKNIIELENMINCLNEIKLNKSSATVVDETVARYYLNKNSLQSEFKILNDEISTEDYVIGLKKGNTDLKDSLENALNQLVENGKAAEISERWFGKNVISFIDEQQKSEKNEEQYNSNFLELFDGLSVTLKLFIICLIFSIPLGLMICLLGISRFKLIKNLIALYVWIMRSTPLLLQIFFMFYGLPLLFPGFQTNNRFLIGTFAFILNYSAYFSEIFRGGFKSIDEGQWDAIKILKIPKTKALFKIVIPQVVKVCLPSVCNENVNLVKDTALIFSIGVIELLTTAKNLVNSQASIFPYVAVLCIYLAICSIVTFGFKYLENKLKF